MNKGTFPLLVLTVGLLAIAAISRAEDWPHWRGPGDNGISAETGWTTQWPAEGPKRLWKASVGTGFSSVAVSHGRLYTLGNDGDSTDTIYCLDAATGQKIWNHSYPCPLDPNMFEGGPTSTPTVDDNCVYSLSRKGDLFCLNATNGAVVWSKSLHKDDGYKIPSWGFASSVLIEGKLAILNMGTSGLALDKKTGAVVWHSDLGTPGYATPVGFDYQGTRVIALAAAKSIDILKVADGKLVWSYPWKTSYDVNAADPIVTGGKLFISSGYGHGAALLDIGSGKPKLLWENKEFRNHISSSVFVNDYIYGVDDVSNHSYELKCLSAADGSVKWSEPSFGKGSLIIADGKILGLSDKGELIVAETSPAAFKPIARAQVIGGRCWTSPVLAQGRVYCRNAKGDLVCLDLKK